jgi:hypothetical protein
MLAQLYPDHRVVDFTGSKGRLRAWREELRFQLWELVVRARHRVGLHTYIPLEEWDTEARSIRFIGEVCWLCPSRT